MSKLESNTTELEEVLAMANALPDAGSGSDGVVVARFEGQDWETITCVSHTAQELFSRLDQGKLPVLAHITICTPDGSTFYSTAAGYAEDGTIVVYDGYSGSSWGNPGDGNVFHAM